MTGGSATSTPRNGRGLAIRSRLWLARPAYPAIRQPSIAVSGGEPATSGSSGLYVHSIRTPAVCQALFIADFAGGEEAPAASRTSRQGRSLLSDGAESGLMCLLSQPLLTRTVSRFTCLPMGSALGSVEVASWRCRTSRRRHAGMRCHGMGNHPAAAAAPASRAGVAGVVGPCPGFAEVRNRNRRSRVMLLGRAPSACFKERDR
jgi:hypothetical protein